MDQGKRANLSTSLEHNLGSSLAMRNFLQKYSPGSLSICILNAVGSIGGNHHSGAGIVMYSVSARLCDAVLTGPPGAVVEYKANNPWIHKGFFFWTARETKKASSTSTMQNTAQSDGKCPRKLSQMCRHVCSA